MLHILRIVSRSHHAWAHSHGTRKSHPMTPTGRARAPRSHLDAAQCSESFQQSKEDTSGTRGPASESIGNGGVPGPCFDSQEEKAWTSCPPQRKKGTNKEHVQKCTLLRLFVWAKASSSRFSPRAVRKKGIPKPPKSSDKLQS